MKKIKNNNNPLIGIDLTTAWTSNMSNKHKPFLLPQQVLLTQINKANFRLTEFCLKTEL